MAITIYDLQSHDVCGHITNISTNILTTLSACVVYSDTSKSSTIQIYSQQCLFVGDSKGLVHVYALHPEFGLLNDSGSKFRNQSFLQQTIASKFPLNNQTQVISVLITIAELNLLFSGSKDGNICVYDISSFDIDAKKVMSLARVYRGHVHSSMMQSTIASISHIPNTTTIVSSCQRQVLVWDALTAAEIYRFPMFTSPIININISVPSTMTDASYKTSINGCKIILTSMDCFIHCYDAMTYALEATALDSHSKSVGKIHGTIIDNSSSALYTFGNSISVWDIVR